MITIKNDQELEAMRRSGKIIADFFDMLVGRIQPGVTTLYLDGLAETFIRDRGAIPTFKGYHGFRGSICASVNDEIVHGIPGKKVLKEGDIIGIDVGASLKGLHADAARTFPVGKISSDLQKLLKVTRESLEAGIKQVKIGNRISDISHAVENVIKPHKYGIVKQYVGHGIGFNLHEEPQIPNYGKPHMGPEILKGMAFAIEPMVNLGSEETRVLDDGWTVVTADGKYSAHFENTVIVTEIGCEITTTNG